MAIPKGAKIQKETTLNGRKYIYYTMNKGTMQCYSEEITGKQMFIYSRS